MIELTQLQREFLEKGKAVRVQDDGREYIMLRPDAYDRLTKGDYDDAPWEAEELDQLRQEAVDLLDSYGKMK